MNPAPGRARRLVVCALYGGVVAVLSLVPARTFQELPEPFPGLDKICHFALYGVFAWLILWALRPAAAPGWRAAVAAILFCVAYGTLMECLQRVLPGGRSFSFGDIAANLLGAVLFAAARAAVGRTNPAR